LGKILFIGSYLLKRKRRLEEEVFIGRKICIIEIISNKILRIILIDSI
jgi:hypothetical protein